MKAITFFLSVFLSMLAVFLVATGEVKRWFSHGEGGATEVVEVTTRVDASSPSKNILEFDFYDVERAKLRFTIRAEFTQEEIQGGTSFEEMSQLTLKNGTLRVPLAGDADDAEPATGAGDARRVENEKRDEAPPGPKNLVLVFQRALLRRGEKGRAAKAPLKVSLWDGKGTLDDGTEFLFEELSLDGKQEAEKAPWIFALKSEKPVSIHNVAFGVQSPTGLVGSLTEHGRQEFHLLPPVSAILDSPGANALTAGTPEAKPPSTPKPGSQRLAAACQGTLDVVLDNGAAAAKTDPPPRSFIAFHKDVVLYPVDAKATVAALPPPKATRFECQVLEIEFGSVKGRPVPTRAEATWPDGRVKANFQREAGGAIYVVDAERLDWLAAGPGPEPPRELASGQAVLHGKPTLRGPGIAFESEAAVYYPAEDRLLLETVKGTLEHALDEEGESKKRGRHEDPRAAVPDLSHAAGAAPEIPEPRSPDTPGGQEERDARARTPRIWDVTADEAEFFFARSTEDGSGAGERKFSHFIARSKEPDGLILKSREAGPKPDNAAESPSRGFIANGSVLTFFDADKKATLESSGGQKPRLVQGQNWVEATKIHVFEQESAVWFEDDVRGRIDDLHAFGTALNSAKEGDGSKGKPAPAAPKEKAAGILSSASSLDIEASFAAVRFDKRTNALRDVIARGSAEAPVHISTVQPPVCRFSGEEVYWDQTREVGQLLSSTPQEGPGPGPPFARAVGHARIEMDGSEIAARKILFDKKEWKAYLTERASLQINRGEGGASQLALNVASGKAEVEFYEGFASDGVERQGKQKELAFIKGFHSSRSTDSLIDARGVIRSLPVAGRAEECTWDGPTRQLRFFGGGEQEIEFTGDELRGPVRAREVVYDEARNLITLQGNVNGRLNQATKTVRPPGTAEASKAAVTVPESGPRKDSLAWRFSTSTLEIRFKDDPATRASALESLRARDKVDLRCEELGIQLRGDDMTYDHESQKMHVFSPDGRPQTLLCDNGKPPTVKEEPADPKAPKEEPPPEKVHKIVSQEIWLLLCENPNAIAARGDVQRWLQAQFVGDVLGSFYVPPVSGGKRVLEDAGDTWKMVAQKLTLIVDPSQPTAAGGDAPRKLIPWAESEGNVVFSSGTLQATAERAVYEDPLSRITLYGSPARLSRENKPLFSEPEIVLLKVGGKVGIEYRPGDGRAPRRPIVPASAAPK